MRNDQVKFKAFCTKKLSTVEADPNRSNQHELNGIAELKKIFGLGGFTRSAIFSVEGTTIQDIAEITWYEARESHPTRSEYRLYFKTNAVMAQAAEGDSILIGLDEADQPHLVLQKILAERKVPFRVQSHVLKLLGDELIGHDRLAVFELVKNSYDADATKVEVTLALDSYPAKIIVKDNGSGMSDKTIENAWLEVGTDSKRNKITRARSTLGRLPLGEKGVGRLAIQKLGDHLKLTTRPPDSAEYFFDIDWSDLINSSKYLGDGLQVSITKNFTPSIFTSGTGTEVEISNLHRLEWTRREVRDLYRLVTSLSNPFDEADSFKVELNLPGREDEIKDLPTLQQMLESAVWNFYFKLDSTGILNWAYEFTPPRFKGLVARTTKGTEKLQLLESDEDDIPIEAGRSRGKKDENIFLKPEDLAGIGPIEGRFHAFHRRDEILKASGAPQQMKKWLDNQTGVRVYRDNIRVFNYGEPGEDWLGLDARRINRPTGKLGTKSVIAQIALKLSESAALKEKTNREALMTTRPSCA